MGPVESKQISEEDVILDKGSMPEFRVGVNWPGHRALRRGHYWAAASGSEGMQ